MKSLQDYHEVLDNLFDGLYITDAERRITFWNRAAERITGYGREEVLGRSCADNILVHVDSGGVNLCNGQCPLAHAIQDHQPRQAEVFLHHKAGHRVPVLVRVSPLLDARGEALGAVEVFSDNTAQFDLAARVGELERMAMLDSFTGLGNRRFLEHSLENLLALYRRYAWPFALVFLDLDDFKQINDGFSHLVGDKVLKMVAGTLQRNVRSFDLLGRWGGEEFLIALTNIDEQRLREVLEKLRRLVEASAFWIDERRVGVTISAGATMARRDDTLQTLIERADQLMYVSKGGGKNRVTIG